MGSDGLTKGAVARALLHAYMNGYMPLAHEFEQWKSKVSGSRQAEAHTGQKASSGVSGSRQAEAHVHHTRVINLCSSEHEHVAVHSSMFVSLCSHVDTCFRCPSPTLPSTSTCSSQSHPHRKESHALS